MRRGPDFDLAWALTPIALTAKHCPGNIAGNNALQWPAQLVEHLHQSCRGQVLACSSHVLLGEVFDT